MGLLPDQVLLSKVNPGIRLHILHRSDKGDWKALCVSGETSALSVQRFDRGAAATAAHRSSREKETWVAVALQQRESLCGSSAPAERKLRWQ